MTDKETASVLRILSHVGYQRVRDLGSGTYGTVWKCIRKSDQAFVAVKHMKFDSSDEGVPSTALREITILKELSHPNIVGLLKVHYEKEKLFLVLEYCSKDLKKLYSMKRKPFPPSLVKSFAYQLLRGIDFCHCNRILHRDLKPQNILVNEDGTLKLADFGLSRAVQILPAKHLTREVVTLWYRAPEILLGCKTYDATVDIWSAGLIIAEMIKGMPVASGDSEIDQLFKVFKILGTPSPDIWKDILKLPHFNPLFPQFKPADLSEILPTASTDALDLIKRLVIYDPKQRACARDCLTHIYFSRTAQMLQDGSMERIFRSHYAL